MKSETDDLNANLRRVFRPLSPPIDISESILDAITILVNLTEPVADQRDLLDRKKCKEKLRDDKWWAACTRTVSYRHSHNVKFPDVRAAGTIRAQPLGQLPDYLFSSSIVSADDWSYSRDSKGVNKASFLTSEFIWQGERSCLGILLADTEHPLWDQLKVLGCYQKTCKAVSKQLAQIPEHIIDVKLAPNYLPQISLPDGRGSYISLSPVASQSIQSHCYQALEEHYRWTALTRYSRATNMGVLAMSCGGAFRMLRSLPQFHRFKHQLLDTRTQWLTKASVKAMRQYLSSEKWLLPANQLSFKRQMLRKQITKMIIAWLDNQDAQYSAQQLTEQFNDELSRTRSASRFAYDVKLTKLIYQIIWKCKENNELQLDDTGIAHSEDTTYLLVPNLKVAGASAMHTHFSIGLPSMMAVYGFVHALERNIQNYEPKFRMDSFAVCIHSVHLEMRGLTREVVEKTDGSLSPPAVRDDWHCDLHLSLVLRYGSASRLALESIVRHLPKRFARGICLISISDINRIQTYTKLKDAILAIPESSGQWLTLNNEECIHSIKDVISALDNRMLTPCCIGYHFLEKLSEKRYSLRGYPHAFCESIMGLLELVTIQVEADFDKVFWRYEITSSYLCIKPKKE
ncbi:type I-F CRISPR-associated protein Csy2 [Photobacterium proteolyticum]|uniref:type I-F CRISPR-associated protein Csy2 n=1 Tax=Photobacterium proteolyticum TaxID=1903952 RepID=UPI0011154079|nr:type I-F CRISPR-associated protein Csy2 [Photobacterium proteolyticum]